MKIAVSWKNLSRDFNTKKELEDSDLTPFEKTQIKYAVECIEGNVFGIEAIRFENMTVSRLDNFRSRI
jgi:hypothetical protein